MLYIIKGTDREKLMAALFFTNGKEKEKEVERLRQQLQELEIKLMNELLKETNPHLFKLIWLEILL